MSFLKLPLKPVLDKFYAAKEHLHGNVTDDGKIEGASNKNVVTDANGKITTENKPTIPSASSTTPSADTTNGSVGSGTTWAKADHTHPKSTIYSSSDHNHDGTYLKTGTGTVTSTNIANKTIVNEDISDSANIAFAKLNISKNDITGLGIPASDTNTTYTAATQSADGLMSSSDKTKLDGIATGANKTTVDSSLSSSSTNPVQNKVINTALSGKAASTHNHTKSEITDFPTDATTSTSGLMSSTDKTKLDGIATSANNYSHPSYTARTGKPTANQTPAFGGTATVSQITSNATGHVTGATDRTITIPSTTATTNAAGLMSSTDKTKLDGIATGANKTTVDSSMSSSSTNPVQNKIVKSAIDAKTVTVEKQSTAETGFVATYVVKQNGTQVGEKINIPKDFLVKSASLKTCTTANSPLNGLAVNDPYLDFVVNVKEGASATDEHIYINVKDLVDTYTAGTGLTLTNGAFSVNYGTAAGTACQGNDSRLSNARTPTSHTHGNITNAGAIGSTANLPIITDTNGVLKTGSFGTTANTFCQGNDSRLSNARTPTSHATTATTYGGGTASNYGHVKVSDNTSSSAGNASQSVAASSAAVKAIYDIANPLKERYNGNFISGVSTVTKPYLRLFHIASSNGSSSSSHLIFEIIGNNNDRLYAKIRVDMRQNNVGANGSASSYTVTPLEVYGFNLNELYFGFYDNHVNSQTCLDIYRKVGAYVNFYIRIADDHLRNGSYTMFTPVANGTESYTDLNEASTSLYNANYTSTSQGGTYTEVTNTIPYTNVNANKFVKRDGTSSQFLKADGSVDSNTYSTTSHTHNYLPTNANGTTTGTLTATKFINSSSNNTNILLGNGNTLAQSTFATSGHTHDYSSTYAAKTHTHASSDVTGLTASKNVVTGSDGKLTTENKPTIPTGSSTATDIKMNGTQSAGSSSNFAKADHVHPIDTSRAPTAHAATATTYGGGTSSNYGHVKVSDNYTSSAGNASQSVAASSKAVNDVYTTFSGTGTTKNAHTHDYSKVSVSPTKTSGVEIGRITVDGTEKILYQQDNNTTYSAVTQAANGLMTKEDKQKIDKSMVVGFANAGGTTSALTATITGATLTHGTIIGLYNAVGNNAANATLNVNSLGAKPIYYNASAITASRFPNKSTCLFVYNTTLVSTGCWQLIYSYDSNTTYSAATQSIPGLMSTTDKTKLDGIATGANKTTVDSSMSSSSTNPVQNKVINSALAGKAASGHTHDYSNTYAAKTHEHNASEVMFSDANLTNVLPNLTAGLSQNGVNKAIDNKIGDIKTWTTLSGVTNGTAYINEDIRMIEYYFSKTAMVSNGSTDLATNVIPSDYRPLYSVYSATYYPNIMLTLNDAGKVICRSTVASSNTTISGHFIYHY